MSYLYQQYNDDEDLQAFVDAFNEIAQAYVDWFNALNLPNYTADPVSGALLDWVALGLYGIARPSLPAGRSHAEGPFNSFEINGVPFNYYADLGGSQFYATSDDTFRRIITWLFFKGDGKVFNVRWLKRRIARFLAGVNGVDFGVADTYGISVTFDPGNQVSIHVDDYAPILKEAIDAGVLELPFQFNYVVTTG